MVEGQRRLCTGRRIPAYRFNESALQNIGWQIEEGQLHEWHKHGEQDGNYLQT